MIIISRGSPVAEARVARQAAAQVGHLAVLQYAHANGCEIDDDASPCRTASLAAQVGSGRIVASEKEAPVILANLV